MTIDELKKLTDDELRVKIAGYMSGQFVHELDLNFMDYCERTLDGYGTLYDTNEHRTQYGRKRTQYGRYEAVLSIVCEERNTHHFVASATERAIAFLVVKGVK